MEKCWLYNLPRNTKYHLDSRTLSDNVSELRTVTTRSCGYSIEDLNCALQEVANGNMLALQAAKKYNVPNGTIYYNIKKLGIVVLRSCRYSSDDLNCAIQEVANGNMLVLQASKKYNVPTSTLSHKVSKLGIVTNRSFEKDSQGNVRYLVTRRTYSPYQTCENENCTSKKKKIRCACDRYAN
ncbi:uncharacterized protein LOC123677950 isoform X1 [Harmonia axyridis]|uniref:uncharacterized protein LOC123677950 isoform X1 n=1 Tax=Harmonia axyridis TaxID=115357 RepID=UPI001E27900E|nr:uncharacterized protein LOC123677950 isoform X1 [Harmonia axyridis]